jgi:type IV pilus biogenesis protein CpaD/CtpE
MKRSLLITGMALMLAGCADEAAEFGRPVPANLATSRREVVAPPGPGYSAGWLRQQAGLIAEGDLQAVHAEIVAAHPREAESLRVALIRAGIDPARITASLWISTSRQRSTIVFTRTVADTGDCRASIDPAFPDDPSRSLMSLGHCLKNNDLANMVVDPADLAAPRKLGRADGAYLASGVRNWRAHGDGSTASASSGASNTTTAADTTGKGSTSGAANP